MSGPMVSVTGGATGVGAAVVDQLLERGASVWVLDVAEVAEREGVTAVPIDLADAASIDAAAAQLPERLGAHINVAGVAGPTPGDWVLKVNFLGLRHLTDQLIPRLSEGGGVVNVSSVAGRNWLRRRHVVEPLLDTPDFASGLEWAIDNEGQWGKDPYTFSKQCVTAWSLRTAQRAAKGAFRINVVSPGGIDTQLTASFRSQMGEDYSDWLRTFTGRSAQPAEIAEPVVWMALGPASWVNGADLIVDRGLESGMTTGWVNLEDAPAR
ncbi:MAG: SDR family oxidoreductase [Actinomycetota bacterium]